MKSANNIPRPEHPRPQFERPQWKNLNGPWTFEFDFGKTGVQRNIHESKGFKDEIVVPFCPESELSGVGRKDFIEAMWYHRKIEIPADWAGKLVLLRFGGVDYESEVYVDGKMACRHFGGSASFEADITSLVTPGSAHNLVVGVRDELRSGVQPGGKQCPDFKSRGCHYKRTTGIWQTVWMEAVDRLGLRSCRITPDFDGGALVFSPSFYNVTAGAVFKAVVFDSDGSVAGSCECPASDGLSCRAVLSSPKSWSPENPHLYDIRFEVADSNGRIADSVRSYAGLRKVHVEGDRLFLNNKPLYVRFVLDQGFYPDGVWTAPSDEALRRDIVLSMNAGFNGARLHQKVFEERFHYWADKLGYLTWGESASWGLSLWRADCIGQSPKLESAWNFLSEWGEIVARDFNHPSIIAWTPLNETSSAFDWKVHRRFHEDVYNLTKSLDPTRPVNEASGYVHQKTDLWTVHYYEQDPAKYKEAIAKKPDSYNADSKFGVSYNGRPYIIDEMGGTKWIPEDKQAFADNTWGYGAGPGSVDEVYSRMKGVVDAILSEDYISGYCYTQLTDVEQEQNGIYNYDRTEKFDMRFVKSVFSRTPKSF